MKRVITIFLLIVSAVASAETPQRIITIGGSLTEIVYALNQQSRLVANDTTSYYPKHAETLPKVGYQRALSAEGILSLNPDLVILTDEAGPPSVISQIQSAGVNVLEVGAGRSITDVKESIMTISKALDCETAGDNLIEKLDKENVHLVEMTANIQKPRKIMFILQHGGGAPLVAGTETAADSIIKLSGGQNVVSQYAGYKPLTPEAAVMMNPDIILITQQGLEQMGGKQALLKSPGLSLTHAAKQQNIIAMDSLFMLGFGPRAIEAAMALNKAIQQ